jgi:hypothetical protein
MAKNGMEEARPSNSRQVKTMGEERVVNVEQGAGKCLSRWQASGLDQVSGDHKRSSLALPEERN